MAADTETRLEQEFQFARFQRKGVGVDTRLLARLRHGLRAIRCPSPCACRTDRIDTVDIRLGVFQIRTVGYGQLHRVEVQRQLVSAAVHKKLIVCIIERRTRHYGIDLRGVCPMQGVAVVDGSVTRYPERPRSHKLHLAGRKSTRPCIYALRLCVHEHTILDTPTCLGSITHQDYLLGQTVCHQAHRYAQGANRKDDFFHTTSPIDEVFSPTK